MVIRTGDVPSGEGAGAAYELPFLQENVINPVIAIIPISLKKFFLFMIKVLMRLMLFKIFNSKNYWQ
jgi:hypothetical protein